MWYPWRRLIWQMTLRLADFQGNKVWTHILPSQMFLMKIKTWPEHKSPTISNYGIWLSEKPKKALVSACRSLPGIFDAGVLPRHQGPDPWKKCQGRALCSTEESEEWILSKSCPRKRGWTNRAGIFFHDFKSIQQFGRKISKQFF